VDGVDTGGFAGMGAATGVEVDAGGFAGVAVAAVVDAGAFPALGGVVEVDAAVDTAGVEVVVPAELVELQPLSMENKGTNATRAGTVNALTWNVMAAFSQPFDRSSFECAALEHRNDGSTPCLRLNTKVRSNWEYVTRIRSR
jgi:hypothetical protein